MPRKTKKSSNKKLKQIITSRLIEISHRIEDYVYNQKLISETEAKQYLSEVDSYKTLCLQDKRSLQVIEKLTRCMNSIIKELREGNPNTINSGPVPTRDNTPRSISPVYSLSDEDRTQFTQTTENNDELITLPNNEIDIIDIYSDDDDTVAETSKDNSKPKINADLDIHRAISNLTLKEIEEVPTNSIFSQSILENFNEFEKNQHDQVTVTSVKPITNHKCVADINTDNTVQNKTVRQITEGTDRNAYFESNTNSYFNQILAIDLTLDRNECNTGITVIPPLHDTNPVTQSVDNKSSEFQNVINATKPNASTKSKINNKEVVVIKNTDSATKKKRRRNKTGAGTEKEPQLKNVTKKRQAPKRPKGFENLDKAGNVPIYNRNVENDLSWLENIRYVREIRPDENDPLMNFEESFWDNYYLPADWNDNEFW